MTDGAELLFNEILNALHQIAEKKCINGSMKVPELRHHIVELEGILQKEKAEFEVICCSHPSQLSVDFFSQHSYIDID